MMLYKYHAEVNDMAQSLIQITQCMKYYLDISVNSFTSSIGRPCLYGISGSYIFLADRGTSEKPRERQRKRELYLSMYVGVQLHKVSDIVVELEGSFNVQERGNLISESPWKDTLCHAFWSGQGWGGGVTHRHISQKRETRQGNVLERVRGNDDECSPVR